MKRILRYCIIAGFLISTSGCYTQFALRTRAPQQPPAPPCDPLVDSTCVEEQNRDRDTVVIREERDRYCYWARDFWGAPVLKCSRSYYSDDWYWYSSDPWWYRSSYGLSYYDRCPRGYYFDSYTGYCRYYRDYNNYYYPIGSRPSGTRPSSGTPSPATRNQQPAATQPRGSRGSVPVRVHQEPQSTGKVKAAQPQTAPSTTPSKSGTNLIHVREPQPTTEAPPAQPPPETTQKTSVPVQQAPAPSPQIQPSAPDTQRVHLPPQRTPRTRSR